jgi:hypothetical protein
MQNETATLGNRTTSYRVQLYGSLTIRACHQTVIAMLGMLTVDCVAIGAGKIQGLAQPVFGSAAISAPRGVGETEAAIKRLPSYGPTEQSPDFSDVFAHLSRAVCGDILLRWYRRASRSAKCLSTSSCAAALSRLICMSLVAWPKFSPPD